MLYFPYLLLVLLRAGDVDNRPVECTGGEYFLGSVSSYVGTIDVNGWGFLVVTKLHDGRAVLTIRESGWTDSEGAMSDWFEGIFLSLVVLEYMAQVVRDQFAHSQPDLDGGWGSSVARDYEHLDVVEVRFEKDLDKSSG